MHNEITFKTGDVVIVRSNEDEPYQVGVFKEFQLITKAQKAIPVIRIDGKDFVVFGIVKAFSSELKNTLDKLSPKEQWNLLSKNYKRK